MVVRIAHVLSVLGSALEEPLATLTPTMGPSIRPMLLQSLAADEFPIGTKWARGDASVVVEILGQSYLAVEKAYEPSGINANLLHDADSLQV